jgi:hypothetical protein
MLKKVIKKRISSDLMPIIIPVWFYGFDAVMYLISSFIGFLLSFYFHKIYSLSSEKRHLYLFWGFLLLSFGLLSLSVTDIYSYTTFWQCRPPSPCNLGILDEAFDIESFSYFLYFGLSIIAYALLMLAYIPQKFKIQNLPIWLLSIYFLVVLVTLPLGRGEVVWYSYDQFFNLIAFLMMVFVSFINFINFSENKSMDSFLVTMSFLFLSLFHLLHIFSFISGWMYVFAHMAMIVSFLSILSVIARVKKK